MKSKSFFNGLAWLLVLNLIVKPLWIFAVDRQVQNVVGHEVYGTYFSLLNLAMVLSFIADAGLSNMITRRMAEERSLNTSHLVQLKLILLLLYTAVCCLAGWLSKISACDILLYTIAIQALGSLFLFLRSVLAAHQLFRTDAFFSIADKTLMTILCGFFLYGLTKPIRIETFLQLQVVSTAGACLLLSILLLKMRLISSEKKETSLVVIRWTLPFAIIILLMSLHYRLDGFLLERMRMDGPVQAGIYATAYRLLDAANMIGYLTASFLVPFVARNKGDDQLVYSVVSKLQHSLLFIAIGTSCFAIMFPAWIQQTLYHTKDNEINTVFQLCLAVLPAYYIVHIYGSLLTAAGNFKVFIYILSASVFINTILNVLLIKNYGAIGCCMAALISQYSCAAACYFTAVKNFSSSFSAKPWVGYLTIVLLFLLLFWLLKMIIPSVWIILAVVILLSVFIVSIRIKFLLSFFKLFIQQKNA